MSETKKRRRPKFGVWEIWIQSLISLSTGFSSEVGKYCHWTHHWWTFVILSNQRLVSPLNRPCNQWLMHPYGSDASKWSTTLKTNSLSGPKHLFHKHLKVLLTLNLTNHALSISLSSWWSHDDHRHYSHNIFSLIWPIYSYSSWDLAYEGHFCYQLKICMWACIWFVLNLQISVWANIRIVYLHISQRVNFPRYQSSASSRNVV